MWHSCFPWTKNNWSFILPVSALPFLVYPFLYYQQLIFVLFGRKKDIQVVDQLIEIFPSKGCWLSSIFVVLDETSKIEICSIWFMYEIRWKQLQSVVKSLMLVTGHRKKYPLEEEPSEKTWKYISWKEDNNMVMSWLYYYLFL